MAQKNMDGYRVCRPAYFAWPVSPCAPYTLPANSSPQSRSANLRRSSTRQRQHTGGGIQLRHHVHFALGACLPPQLDLQGFHFGVSIGK
jgi:hypothetical protein